MSIPHVCIGNPCVICYPRQIVGEETFIGQMDPPKTLSERLRVPRQVPVTERMPEACPCCGFVHAPKPPLRFDRLPGQPQEPDGFMRPNPFT